MSKKHDHEWWEKQLKELGNGEYIALDKYISINEPVKVKHLNCGLSYYVRPSNFIYQRSRCPECAETTRRERNSKGYYFKSRTKPGTPECQDAYEEHFNSLYGDRYELMNTYKGWRCSLKLKCKRCGTLFYILARSLAKFPEAEHCIMCKEDTKE